MTCGELAERMTSLKVNLSTGLMDGLSLSKRFMMMLNIVEVSTCKASYKLERLTLSGSQIKTWNRVVLRGQRSNLVGPRGMKTILPMEVGDDCKEILK